MLNRRKTSIFESLPNDSVRAAGVEPDVIPNLGISTSSLFDGVFLLKFDPKQSEVSVSYVSDFLVNVLGAAGSTPSVEVLNQLFDFGRSNNPDSLQSLCKTLLSPETGSSLVWSGELRTAQAQPLPVSAEFRLMPLDLKSEQSGTVSVLVLSLIHISEPTRPY